MQAFSQEARWYIIGDLGLTLGQVGGHIEFLDYMNLSATSV